MMNQYSTYKEVDIPWLKKIPQHWGIVRNREILKEKTDVVGENFSNYTLLSLTTKGVIPRDLESGKGKFPSDFKSYKIVKENDIAFCLFDIDETPRTVGLSKEEGMLTSAYTIYQVSELLPEYVTYYYTALDDIKALRYFYSGLRKTIKADTFLSMKMPVPSIVEQRQIVDYLNWQTSRMNKLISTKRRELKLVKEIKHNKVKSLVFGLGLSGKRKQTDNPWMASAPEKWTKVKLRNLFTEIKVPVGSDSEKYTLLSLTTNGVIVRDLSEAKGKFPSDFSAYQVVDPGQFVFCLFDIDETPRTVGLADIHGMITGAYTVFDVDHCNPEYLLQLFTVLDDEKAFKPLYSGLRKVIKVNNFLNQNIYLPSEEEQGSIVSEIQDVISYYENIESVFRKEIKVLTDLKKQIVFSVVTGKLDVSGIKIPNYEYTEDDGEDEDEEQED